MPRCVLFDLDGTLADTAPDLSGALNRVRQEEGLAPLPLSVTRPVTSQGVRGLLRVGFDLTPEDGRYPGLAERVLTHYAAHICEETRLFDGLAEVLGTLESRDTPWGIVTNKHSRFTLPLVRALGLEQRAACVVSGDSAARPKPHPDTLLHACAQLSLAPADCVYVGDDERDVLAGRAAGMATVVAAWGYLGQGTPPEAWGADRVAATPGTLLDVLAALPVQS
ncbi:HAD-IA family hydrolase [Niveibacterium sp. SC-1]|uniref:HAD family hydrolase n=1 Tax=Niveibacterium sp. SC-1 TaxID=3135646 RepID=UPI00311E860E